jgi:hypothetical protein
VAGVAPVGARVLVNTRPVSLDDKGRFATVATVSARSPIVVFELLPASGPAAIAVRSLRRGH